ncbi:PaaI family thioesterase [Faecalibaculum rodentium]|jgi:acyl-CoA thioesterase|uniref:PaaI family thioesterase n=1 Tax=Faecalibaculum rodentium TaxID=1702221 RepID=UPI0024924767|nr:PaaI family thioesterase [Faecalibaculum rodentium]
MHETNHTQQFQETAEEQEARFEGLKKRLNSSSKYLQSNDMRVTELRQGYARVEMTIDEHILNIHGFVHGGALFSLADTAAGSASFTTGRDSVTLSASINYLSPGRGGRLIAIGSQVKAGKTTGVYEVFIYNEHEDLLCRATTTVFFLDSNRHR